MNSQEFVIKEGLIRDVLREFPDVIDSPENRVALRTQIDEGYGGVYNRSTIRQAVVWALRDKLKAKPESRREIYAPVVEALQNEPLKPPRLYAPVEKIREVIAVVKQKFPWYAATGASGEANLSKIFSWLHENNAAGFTLETVLIATEALSPELEWDPAYVPPPTLRVAVPEPPKPEPEILRPGQLSIHASKRQLGKATPDQLRDYLVRVREAQKK